MTGVRAMTLYRRDGRATVFLAGEIDADTAPAVGAAVDDSFSRETGDVDIELADVSFCDASGLNVFLAAALSADASGRRLRLRHPTPAVRRVFDLTGTATLLDAAQAEPPYRPEDFAPMSPVPGPPAASGDQ
ncbi:anti-anti-sigma factor [Streptomyces sp. 2231.1]|uniref:STAS domain-containing protein n=1 Tax=Streptomyces sp. 2231.1 TaxID=1855347 RepID=UPI00089B6766|nr:STAS domain-containing protein [Streptomyces sp. 2231.1]SEC46957.1 anti-anti-sigma factor [Streptomyces sp. 2231.1]